MRVSIFTPTNDTRFLKDVYDSIKDQDFYEWIIVYNNGATPLEFDDVRVKEFTLSPSPEWIGPLKAHACEKATGDILLELDHDDFLTPDAVEEVKKAFADSEVGFVYSNTINCHEGFKKTKRYNEKHGWKYREVEFRGHALDECIAFPPTPASVSRIWYAPNHLRAFRADVYREIGGYATDMRVLDDLDLMCRMYQVTKFKHIDKGLYVYVIHGDNSWLKYNKEIQNNVYRIYDKYIDSMVEHWADMEGLRKIELGGRTNARDGYETVDLTGTGIIHDLNTYPWPFEDNSVGVIRAIDIFEHLKNPVQIMKECSRILVPGGWLMCRVPSTDGRGAFQDPTHVSYWCENSFWYYTKDIMAQYIDTPVRFQAPRLYTTVKNNIGVCWTIAHLINLKDGHRPPGLIEISDSKEPVKDEKDTKPKAILWGYRFGDMKQSWRKQALWLAESLRREGYEVIRHSTFICNGLVAREYNHKTDNPCDLVIYNHADVSHIRGKVVKADKTWFFKPTVPDEVHTSLDTLGFGPYSTIAYKEPNFNHVSQDIIDNFFNTKVREWIEKKTTKWPLFENNEEVMTDKDYFLVLGQCAGDETTTRHDFGSHFDKVHQIVRELSNIGGRNIIVKLHPYTDGKAAENDDLSRKLKERFDKIGPLVNTYIGKLNVHNFIENAHCVILSNSGSGFEAMMHHKPIISWGYPEYHWVTYDLRHLADLERATKLDWFDKDKQDRFLYWFLEKYCFYDQETTHRRVKELLEAE